MNNKKQQTGRILMARSAVKNLSALFVAAAATFLAPQEVSAQGQQCTSRSTIIEQLNQRFGESQQARMLTNDRQILELYANQDSSSWTIVETNLTDEGALESCLTLKGEYFQNRDGQTPIIVDSAPETLSMRRRGCAPHEAMVNTLQENYGEEPQYSMLAPNLQFVFHIYADEGDGSWTFTRTNADGLSCMLNSGAGYQETNKPRPPQGERVSYTPN